MYKPLKFKIPLAAFLIISIIMTISTMRSIDKTEYNILAGQKEKAELMSDRVSHGIMLLMLKNNWQELKTFIRNIVRQSEELTNIRIFLPDGRIVASSDPGESGRKIQKADLVRFRRGNVDAAFLAGEGDTRYASKLTVFGNQPTCYGCHDPEKKVLGIMRLDLSLARVNTAIRQSKNDHLMDTLIVLAFLGGGFLVIIAVWIERPIRNMMRTIQKVEGGDAGARMHLNSSDEFGHLAQSFNSMLDSLQSAQKEIEDYHSEQMQRAAKLASLGEIISSIAHEIRNPLTGISCAVQMIHAELHDDDGRKEVTAEILQHIRRLDGTVKGLLNYARPKPPSFLPLDVNAVLEKAVFFVYPEAKKKNVKITRDEQHDMHEAMMDSDQMQQVFLNLMINAVQAMPDGGTLKISTSDSDKYDIREEAPEALKGKQWIRIEFEDTGTGLEDKNVERIFDPFYTEKTRGTGLGLSISRRIVQEHGGEITVKSRTGRGSTFTVYLPAVNHSRPDSSMGRER